MKCLLYCFLWLLSLFAISGFTEIRESSLIETSSLRPTQFTAGFYAVEIKREKIEKLYQEGKLRGYLRKKVAPIVISPDGEAYLLDRHHLGLALNRASIPKSYKRLYTHTVKHYTSLSTEAFWKQMRKEGFVNLLDQNAIKSPRRLPLSLDQLRDDPHRSFVWLLKNEGLISKPANAPPFFEFYVANALRSLSLPRGPWTDPRYRSQWEELFPKAQKIMKRESKKSCSDLLASLI